MASKRYIVVGAGLAGCLLAWRLEQKGQSVLLIGSTQMPGASEVAGGIINPVTGRWMTKSWRFDESIPHAAATYRELEQQFGIRLYQPIPFVRYCQNETDVKRGQRRRRNPRYSNVLGDYAPVKTDNALLKDTHGSFQVKQAAHVDLPLLLKTLRDHFAKQNIFRDGIFDYTDLIKEDHNWRYNDLQVNHVIFCEGTGLKENPWFKQLPLTPVKGETLTFRCPTLQLPRSIYHRGKWLLPEPENSFRIGATYDDQDPSEAPTEAGKQELIDAARELIAPQHALDIRRHTAGLRPCTQDFRPFVGSHPTLPGLHIVNGLGSKGALLAPETIRKFLDYLLQGRPLEPEIDCNRP